MSPTNANSEQLKNSFYDMTMNNDFLSQFMNFKTKKNLKGNQVKISHIQINSMTMDKQTEKSVKEICQTL